MRITAYQHPFDACMQIWQERVVIYEERRFDCVEVCVKNKDMPALRLYEKIGI